ncbi:hypothetical protein Sjap_018021 [Stephania japonica]|uniref:K Homology domain-containing protein n=2 Tax=Magnoliopsida TaxID=3398 RepID=A0AAP0NMP4_9MAGN
MQNICILLRTLFKAQKNPNNRTVGAVPLPISFAAFYPCFVHTNSRRIGSMAEEEVVVAAAVASEAPESTSPVSSDHKRKLQDLEPNEAPPPPQTLDSSASPVDPSLQDSNGKPEESDRNSSSPETKRPRLESEPDAKGVVNQVENGHEVVEAAEDNAEAPPEDENRGGVDGERSEVVVVEAAENEKKTEAGDAPEQLSADNVDPSEGQQPSLDRDDQEQQPRDDGDFSSGQQEQVESEDQTTMRKMEVPNNKVGVLIGKAGETIRLLQFSSGAKIQITRDSEADSYSSTRSVEIIGTLESINKAEKLIKDVIAEAEAGGSPSLVAKGFGSAQASGPSEQIQIQVPNEKVGLIIGKGGETIKSLQTRSGARIQLIPQHLPEGDQSKERAVRVTGDKKQIEIATEMIKEVMSQNTFPFEAMESYLQLRLLSDGFALLKILIVLMDWIEKLHMYNVRAVVRPSTHGGYKQQSHRPRGAMGPPHWGPRTPQSGHAAGYNYQRGMHPSQNPQYPGPAYGGYPPHQHMPRGNIGGGWEPRPSGHMQGPQSGSYDYYGHGGPMADTSASINASNAVPASAGGAHPNQGNYNYGQSHGPEYGHPMPYSQTGHPQQSYGHGYEDPKYANQVPMQPAYGAHGNPQAGAYSQANSQPGYGQQPYARPPAYGGPPQPYGPTRPSQHGDVPYQNPAPSAHSYGQTVAPQQQLYPYASSGSGQQTYPYGSAPAADGYNQPQAHAAPAPTYPQQNAQPVPAYGQPGGQPALSYVQGGPAGGGYGPYPSSQQGYSEQQTSAVANYGYQAPDGAYGNAQAPAYNAGPSGFAQTANQPSYEQQPISQAAGYASVPGSAPPGYAKNVSPQPVYNQYDSAQMYGGQHQ